MSEVVFKKRSRPTKNNIRSKNETNSDSDDGTTKIVKTELRKNDPINTQTTKKITDDSGISLTYESSRDIAPATYAGNATYITEIDTAVEKDRRTILERNIALNDSGVLDNEPKVYRGQGGYKSYVHKDISQVGSNKYSGTQGPIRAPTFVRNSARFDYQPDICKDYKETGFCGYGDSCKFLHDRGDYKSGWQLEKEWDDKQRKKKMQLEDSLKKFSKDDHKDDEMGIIKNTSDDNIENDDEYAIDLDKEEALEGGLSLGEDGLPFGCFICRSPFDQPIKTTCGHYFCRQCAIVHHKQSTKCAACGKPTLGVFNRAWNLEKKMKRIREEEVKQNS